MNLKQSSKACLLAVAAITASSAFAATTDGSDLIRSGHFSQATTQLERELKQNNDSAALHCNLGIALLHSRNYRPALQQLLKATQLEATLTAAWLNLAPCFICINEFDRAANAYRKVENLMPQSQPALDPLIDFLSHASRVDETSADYAFKGWKHWQPGTTVNVYVAHHPRYRDIAIESMTQLCKQTKLQPVFVDNKQDAQFLIDWIKPANGTMLLERGTTSCVAKNGFIVGAISQISIANETGFDFLSDDILRKTCLHEIMHGLGVEGHSANVEDIMFPMIELPVGESSLTERDKTTLMRLYSG